MSTSVFQSMGIVMNALPFKDRDRILTLFTQEKGVIKLFVKGRQITQNALTERFTVVDILCSRGRGELYLLSEASVVEQHPEVRATLKGLQIAEKMSRALLMTQWEEKEAPSLFALFIAFLKKIPQEGLWAPFLVKLLKHEGVLQMEEGCAKCEKGSSHRFGGERYCSSHAPKGAKRLGEGEESLLRRLYESRSFDEMCKTPFTQEFEDKIESLFNDLYSR